MSLSREGLLGASPNYGSIDSLTYTYSGNQLQSVYDLTDPNHQNNGFSDDDSFVTTEYQYDLYGNMISDLNKRIDTIHYNHLNLPDQIDITPTSATQEIDYLYSAVGQKLQKATRINSTPATTTDYIGSFIYQDGLLQAILTAEGRVVVDGSSYEYQYFLKDHLGNTRITFNENKKIIQEDSYYPFGMAMSGLSESSGTDLPNKYLYNGKELQNDFGLGWYDYGARFYDAALGCWHCPDPLAEVNRRWSPYRYAYNNPLRFIDPDGMLEDWWVDEDNGQLINTADSEAPEGDNIAYLGEDGMFGALGEKIEKGIQKMGSDARLSLGLSEYVAESAGFTQIEITETKQTTQTSTHPDAMTSPVVITQTLSESTDNKVTYMPQETASKLNGSVDVSYGDRKQITPNWSFSAITRETKTTTTYSTDGKTNAPKDHGTAITIGKLLYDVYDNVIKPAIKNK